MLHGFFSAIDIIAVASLVLLAANVLAFALFAADKSRARRGKWRIKESVLMFFALVGGIGAALAMGLLRHKIRKTKFKIAAALGFALFLAAAFHVVHAVTIDRTVRFVELDFYVENWPAALDGYRIAFMSDFHIMPHENMTDIAEELNRRDIDLLLLGGDFAMHGQRYLYTLTEIAKVETRDGIFGVDGNHDSYRRLFDAMAERGMTPLNNSGLHIHDNFFLAGVQDFWKRSPNIAEATAGANPGDFILLVSHNPDVAMGQPTAHIGLTLAGHTHGGQIAPFGLPVYLLLPHITSYGMRFGGGFAASADGTPVFVTNGVGDYYYVPRILAPPEVVIFTMRSP